jgi:hypothetical protein
MERTGKRERQRDKRAAGRLRQGPVRAQQTPL